MIAPRTLTLAGCHSRAEANDRITVWLREIAEESALQFESSMLAAVEDGRLDLDAAADAIEGARAANADGVDECLRHVWRVLDRLKETP